MHRKTSSYNHLDTVWRGITSPDIIRARPLTVLGRGAAVLGRSTAILGRGAAVLGRGAAVLGRGFAVDERSRRRCAPISSSSMVGEFAALEQHQG